jgi:hypothetical protein
MRNRKNIVFILAILAMAIPATTLSSQATSTEEDITEYSIAYYQFNEGEGSTAADSSGNHLDGTIYNGLWTTRRDLSDSALTFDKTQIRYVLVADDDKFDLDVFTISADIKPESDINTWPRGYQTIVSKEYQYILRFFGEYTTGRHGISAILFYSRGGYKPVTKYLDDIDSSLIPQPGEWSTIKMTYDGSSLKLYINNNLIGETDFPAASYPPYHSDAALLIGNHQSGGGYPPFSSSDEFIGSIDNVMISGKQPASTPSEPEDAPIENEVEQNDAEAQDDEVNDPVAEEPQEEIETEDGNNGHGNDPDHVDDSNPGNSQGHQKQAQETEDNNGENIQIKNQQSNQEMIQQLKQLINQLLQFLEQKYQGDTHQWRKILE